MQKVRLEYVRDEGKMTIEIGSPDNRFELEDICNAFVIFIRNLGYAQDEVEQIFDKE